MLSCWPTLNGVAVGDGSPLLTAVSGSVILGQLSQFESHSLVFDAADEQTLLSMQPFTLLELVQDHVGTIGFGYVVNPVEQITDQDEHTITMELLPRAAAELTWRRTRRGWTATGFMSQVHQQLIGLQSSLGWFGVFTGDPTDLVTGGDFQMTITLQNPTILTGAIQAATQFNQYLRIGRDGLGVENRTLEMGQFGAAAKVYFQDIKGGNILDVQDNNLVKIIATITRQPNDVRDLLNVCTPFGGGNDAQSLVTLERCWRIVNDPKYPNFGRWGTDAQSIARTGLPSMFPEYDPVNYPISDPENPPTGTATFVGGILYQGALGTRAVTRTEGFAYCVYDAKSYAAYGYKEGEYIDSTLDYADQSASNQELTSRALYFSIITQFKKFAQPHHLFTCSVPGTDLGVREGDLVFIDYQHTSTQEDGGLVVSTDVQTPLRVMKRTRNFQGEEPPTDDYLLSNLGRYDNEDSQQATGDRSQLVAVQLKQGTSFSPMFFGPFADNVDAITPISLPVTIPPTLYAWGRCSLRVDFQQFTQGSTTAYSDPNISFDIEIGGQDVLLDTPNDINLTGTFSADGSGAVGTTDGFDLIQSGTDNDAAVQILIDNDGGLRPLGDRLNALLHTPSGQAPYWTMSSGTIPQGSKLGTNMKIKFTKAMTAAGFTAPIAKNVIKKTGVVARLLANSIITKLPPHTHLLDQKVGKGSTPVGCIFSIDGVQISSSVLLTSGTRNADGSFSSSFEIDDIGLYINKPGQTVVFEFASIANGDNPTGAGRFQVTGTWFGQFGGLAATVAAG